VSPPRLSMTRSRPDLALRGEGADIAGSECTESFVRDVDRHTGAPSSMVPRGSLWMTAFSRCPTQRAISRILLLRKRANTDAHGMHMLTSRPHGKATRTAVIVWHLPQGSNFLLRLMVLTCSLTPLAFILRKRGAACSSALSLNFFCSSGAPCRPLPAASTGPQ
jgi:hypothetical protein